MKVKIKKMKRRNNKYGRFTLSGKIRSKLRWFEISDRIEFATNRNRVATWQRRLLQDRFPDAHPDEIEERLRAILAHGMRAAPPAPAQAKPKFVAPIRRRRNGGRRR